MIVGGWARKSAQVCTVQEPALTIDVCSKRLGMTIARTTGKVFSYDIINYHNSMKF